MLAGYDYGMLDTAKGLLRKTLTALRVPIRAGIPIVGLEPSCVTVFRDELINLFPNEQDARRLSKNTMVLSEFLQAQGDRYRPPELHRNALVHGHCHHKSLLHFETEIELLNKSGVKCDQPSGQASQIDLTTRRRPEPARPVGADRGIVRGKTIGPGE